MGILGGLGLYSVFSRRRAVQPYGAPPPPPIGGQIGNKRAGYMGNRETIMA